MIRAAAYAIVALAALAGIPAASAIAPKPAVVLPNGWVLSPPRGPEVATGTMPQGMAASPDGSTIAVVESGYNPAILGLYRVPDLARAASIALPGAFGRPVWIDARHVLVAGANSDALLEIDVTTRRIDRFAFPKGSYPVAVAQSPDGKTLAVATDADAAVRIGTLESIGTSDPIAVGAHPSGIAFGAGGSSVFVTSRAANQLVKIDVASRTTQSRPTGLHPSALAVTGNEIYVAQSDADSVGVYDPGDLHAIATVRVGDAAPSNALGVSPDAVTVGADGVFVSLGAANSIAVLRDDRLAGRIDAGWYPTDALDLNATLYVLDGKGEGSRPNPRFNRHDDDVDYIGAIEFGSLRAYPISPAALRTGNPQGSRGWNVAAPSPLLRPGGPIKHVFFVLKENRSYDQVLGDMAAGNGDPALTWFGRDVTPNQHAIAARFGLFDNAYTSGEVSAAGHNWSDAGFANDYVERWWPALYGGRRALDDLTEGGGARLPASGFLWDAARRAGVSFRDYGELVAGVLGSRGPLFAAVPSLRRRFDPRYVGWDLRYSDLDRAKEWRREFAAQVASGTLPQL
ncbi:MAG TPA: YncE family protein, partial [Candidatus Tumulicola sp.]